MREPTFEEIERWVFENSKLFGKMGRQKIRILVASSFEDMKVIYKIENDFLNVDPDLDLMLDTFFKNLKKDKDG